METTTKTNTQAVQECFGYFGAGNIPALLNELTGDVKWISPQVPGLPWSGDREGKAAVADFFKLLGENAEFLAFEPREFFEKGNKVVCLGYGKMKSKKTGKMTENDWVMTFTFKGNKISHFQEYVNTYAGYEAFKP